ncbi:MAG: hypothetical protein LBL53_00355 [Endomicrobium sp.]|jgi:hypothetical protein|nr:hypothetical protein [Endomicrobium sp.]
MIKFKFKSLVFISAILILILNKGNRTLIRRIFELNELKNKISIIKQQNLILKKKLYFLRKSPKYLKREICNELNVIAPGEVEYRWRI